jgi:translation initiation factor 2 beta subunit (eIF-2beta)/eIF-5
MADKKQDKEEKLVAVRTFIPSELRNSFKSICVKQGVTMDSVISKFIEEYIQEYEKEKK